MEDKPRRPAWLRALNALCAVALLSCVVGMIVFGFHAAAMAFVALSLAGVAPPVVLNGEGILEILAGIVEAVVDGVLAIIEGIASAVAGIFG